MTELAASYRLCGQLARQTARNFYYSFLTLGHQQRRAMCALYAFLRRTDDLGDSIEPAGVRRDKLRRWRRQYEQALHGRFTDALLPAVADTLHRYRIPPQYLHDVIDGVEMDLEIDRYETFDDLCTYCRRVASAVGLACIHVWGFRGPEAFEPATRCGIAFQITNILRDLKEDAQRGRFYLPQEDLRRFHYTEDDLRRGLRDERFARLMAFQIQRARQFYREGAALHALLDAGGRAAFGAMFAIYHGLLHRIAQYGGDVFTRRVKLSAWRKWWIAGQWLLLRPQRLEQAVELGEP